MGTPPACFTDSWWIQIHRKHTTPGCLFVLLNTKCVPFSWWQQWLHTTAPHMVHFFAFLEGTGFIQIEQHSSLLTLSIYFLVPKSEWFQKLNNSSFLWNGQSLTFKGFYTMAEPYAVDTEIINVSLSIENSDPSLVSIRSNQTVQELRFFLQVFLFHYVPFRKATIFLRMARKSLLTDCWWKRIWSLGMLLWNWPLPFLFFMDQKSFLFPFALMTIFFIPPFPWMRQWS